MAACCGAGGLSPSLQVAWRRQSQNSAESGHWWDPGRGGSWLVSRTLVRRDRNFQRLSLESMRKVLLHPQGTLELLNCAVSKELVSSELP